MGEFGHDAVRYQQAAARQANPASAQLKVPAAGKTLDRVPEQLQRIVAMGMRVLGGRAYFEFEEMARYAREAPFSLYAGGTVEIQKMLIARQMGLV